MLLFAHAGLTLGAAIAGAGIWRKVRLSGQGCNDGGGPGENNRRSLLDPANLDGIDARYLLVGSLLPDIIDKPIGILFLGNGRVFAHTLLFIAFLGILAVVQHRRSRQNWLSLLFLGSVAHMILDSMWETPGTLFWPFLGLDFPRQDVVDWVPRLLRGLLTNPVTALAEIAGLIIAAWFGIALLRRKKVIAFIRRGRLD